MKDQETKGKLWSSGLRDGALTAYPRSPHHNKTLSIFRRIGTFYNLFRLFNAPHGTAVLPKSQVFLPSA